MVVAGVGVALACSLTACTPASHIYARQDGDNVVFLSCEPGFEVNQIAVSFFPASSTGVTVWQIEGAHLAIGLGSEYITGQALPGATTTVPYSMTADQIDGGAFEIAFDLLDADGAILSNKVASFAGSKLSETAWIDSNGVTVAEPC
jgi:hypothetical protein